MTKEQQKQLYGFGLPIILGTILLLGASYAWLQLTLNGTKDNVLKVGTLSLELDDKNSVGINGDGVVPMLDEVGLMQEPYTFTLRNNGKVDSEYTIYLEDVALSEGESKLPDEVIKYNLEKDQNSVATDLLSTTIQENKRVLDTGIIKSEEEYTYDLRLWVDQNATREQAAGKVFKGIIKVEAEQVFGKPTPEACFTFEKETGTITAYLCGPKILNFDLGDSKPNSESPIGKIITDVVIPKTIGGTAVKKIDSVFGGSFGEGTGITSVVIPDGITEFGDSAFAYNELTSVTIPASVTKIGQSAFASISGKISSVTLSEGLEEIGAGAFMQNKISSIIIPASVKKIGDYAFSKNNLTKVIMKGKHNIFDFEYYGSGQSYLAPFYGGPGSAWLAESSCDTYATEHNPDPDFGDNTNPCIDWELKN